MSLLRFIEEDSKVLSGTRLLRKYKAALAERNRQTEAHRGFTENIPTQLVKEWEQICVAWDSECYPKNGHAENPYQVKSMSEFPQIST